MGEVADWGDWFCCGLVDDHLAQSSKIIVAARNNRSCNNLRKLCSNTKGAEDQVMKSGLPNRMVCSICRTWAFGISTVPEQNGLSLASSGGATKAHVSSASQHVCAINDVTSDPSVGIPRRSIQSLSGAKDPVIHVNGTVDLRGGAVTRPPEPEAQSNR